MKKVITTALVSVSFLHVCPLIGGIHAVSSVRVADGFSLPANAVAPPGDFSRLFINENNTGTVRILNLDDFTVEPDPFLTIPEEITATIEEGLLGMVFHPDYQNNGRFYVNYTTEGLINIVEFKVDPDDPNRADPLTARPILRIANTTRFHQGGWMDFNPVIQPDEPQYLYISVGDDAVVSNAQDTSNLRGTILRIDVNADDFPNDPDRNYAIPSNNPFVGAEGADEIWAFGLRNPWRASFDRHNGDMFIGDVGGDSREEIDLIPAGSAGGLNFGWSLREGSIPTPGVGGPAPEGAVEPIWEYAHEDGANCITGGYRYRGPIEALQGRYIAADCNNRTVFLFSFDGEELTVDRELQTQLTPPEATLGIDRIRSFGEDAAGRLFILDGFGGEVFMVILLGDMDGNGRLDAFDVDDLELALADREAFLESHPDFTHDTINFIGDTNRDGQFDAFDVSGFELLLAGVDLLNQESIVPEPTMGVLMLIGAMGLCGRRSPHACRSAFNT